MKVKPGDIFECGGSFYQTIRATAKTATVRPIEGTFVGYADPYGWERKYLPVPGRFTSDPWMGRERSEREGSASSSTTRRGAEAAQSSTWDTEP